MSTTPRPSYTLPVQAEAWRRLWNWLLSPTDDEPRDDSPPAKQLDDENVAADEAA